MESFVGCNLKGGEEQGGSCEDFFLGEGVQRNSLTDGRRGNEKRQIQTNAGTRAGAQNLRKRRAL